MGFSKRSKQGELLVRLFEERYWSRPEIEQYGLIHQDYGYETHIRSEVRDALTGMRDPTAKGIRFTPDFLLIDERPGRKSVIMLEYKSTTTPRYTEGDNQWNVGQCEADAWEAYLRLIDSGQRVALLNYCSYHPRPLLCDFVSSEWEVSSRQRVARTSRGSGTDYVNIDLSILRKFDEFMKDEFGVPRAATKKLTRRILKAILKNSALHTKHDRRSPQYGDAETGFNWIPPD